MTSTTILNFKQKCLDYFEQAINYREPVTVTTEIGNAVVLSEEYYRGLIATLELSADPKFYSELKNAINEPLEECIDSSAVLIQNIDKIHTTELGVVRIKRNLDLTADDIINWCKQEIRNAGKIYRKGKNWYVITQTGVITINAHSYTIITAHKNKQTIPTDK